MRKALSLSGLLGGVALALAAGSGVRAGIDVQDFQQMERGRYLTIVGDCAACHTLPGSGHDLAGGRAIETPFGELIAPNITPDPLTGIGAWTDEEFINAMTKGTGRNGTRLYPAMPYTYYTRITRDDALAIRAYLNSVPAVQNAVEANQLPFPFDIRASMIGWNMLYFTPGEFHPVANKSAEWNRGAYLAEGLGHCGLCHSPKNFLGGDRNSHGLQGYALQGWFAADITNGSRRGLGLWSVDDIATYLKTGHSQTSIATGLMAETISQSTSHMTDADLRAIAVYLKDQPGGNADENQQPVASDQPVMKVGAAIYSDQCSGCHAANGRGNSRAIPCAPRFGTGPAGRSNIADACCAARLAQHRYRQGPDGSRHAGIWLAAKGRRSRGCLDLYPQFVGKRRAGRHSGGGQQRPARIRRAR